MGYFKVPDWFVDKEMRGMTNCELRILLFLVRVANKKGKSWYSQIKIAETTSLSRKTVNETMVSMRKNGWIEVKKRFHDTSIIAVHPSFIEKSM